jgi:hypothetical protein
LENTVADFGALRPGGQDSGMLTEIGESDRIFVMTGAGVSAEISMAAMAGTFPMP